MTQSTLALSDDTRLPLYQRLAESIKTAIVDNRWRPGDRLPAEKDLAGTYGVAPGTARQAITLLIKEGLLERQHGSGTFVRRPSFNNSLFRFFRFETKSGERKIPESRILHREVITAPSAIAQALNLKPEASVIAINRLRLLEGNPVMIEDIWLEYERFERLLEMDENDIGPLLYPIYDSHFGQIVCRANESLTVETADESYANMLRVDPGAPVIVIERLATGIDGKPIEWRRSRGLADQFHYNIEIN